MKTMVFVMALLAATATFAGNNITGEYESRTAGDKVNLWYRTPTFEAYALKTPAFLEVEIGPRFYPGNFTIATKVGAIWRVKESTVVPVASINILFKRGRLACLSVNDVPLEKDWKHRLYQEGDMLIGIPEVKKGLSLGAHFEHYYVLDEQKWVVGPRVQIASGTSHKLTCAVWAGFTDNPTAAIFLKFETPH